MERATKVQEVAAAVKAMLVPTLHLRILYLQIAVVDAVIAVVSS